MNQPQVKRPRAAYYLRVSTARQVDGTSLDTQQAWCLAHIESNGWEDTGGYIDAGASGASNTRPEWVRLLNDAREGKIDVVLVFDLDRFTRDMLHGLQATRDLRDLGIKLIDAKDPATDVASADQQLMTGFRLLIAQEERRKIAERTIRGQRAKLEQGLWPGGQPSYGWKLAGSRRTAHPVPDVAERETLRLMYDWLVRDGLSVGQISDQLNDAGIKSRNAGQSKHGGKWGHVVVRRILSNPTLHTASFVWGEPKGGSTDSRSHKTKVDRNGQPLHGKPRIIEMGNPVFSRGEFRAMHRALARHPRTGTVAAKQVRQMLSTKLYGSCGKHYIGVQIKGKDYDVYRCSGRRYRGQGAQRCQCKQVNAQKLDSRVWAEVESLLSDPGRLTAMARQWLELDDEPDAASGETVARSLTDQVRKLERALERAKDAFLMEDDPEDARLRVERFRGELQEAQRKLLAVQSLRQDALAKAERLTDLAKLAERARGRLSSMDPDQRREVLDLLGVSVVMQDVVESVPLVLTVHGQVDPRMFVSEPEQASNPEHGEQGGNGVFRGCHPRFPVGEAVPQPVHPAALRCRAGAGERHGRGSRRAEHRHRGVPQGSRRDFPARMTPAGASCECGPFFGAESRRPGKAAAALGGSYGSAQDRHGFPPGVDWLICTASSAVFRSCN
ncbi:recombinase family protein [Arthrobacter citreus]|uniref:Recombinase family protein n=1 Tax=Arthrobacter citreus TaxID=1670 RepID=A0ABZ2ZV74_9MICC